MYLWRVPGRLGLCLELHKARSFARGCRRHAGTCDVGAKVYKAAALR